jgi:cytochrome-b5 reductase
MSTNITSNTAALLLTAAAIAIPLLAVAVHKLRVKCKPKPQAPLNTPQIDPDNFTNFAVARKEQVTHDTWLFRFSLPDLASPLGLSPGQHIQIRVPSTGSSGDCSSEYVIKPYTPVSLSTALGHFDLLIKTYPNGRVSGHMAGLDVDDTVEMRGPKGSFKFTANMAPVVGMVAGGTGITPILSVIRAILVNPDDHTKIVLLFANKTPADILLWRELDELQDEHRERFSVHYTIDNPDDKWDGLVGRVSGEMMREVGVPCFDGGKGKVLICGPPPMVTAVTEELRALGYEGGVGVSRF